MKLHAPAAAIALAAFTVSATFADATAAPPTLREVFDQARGGHDVRVMQISPEGLVFEMGGGGAKAPADEMSPHERLRIMDELARSRASLEAQGKLSRTRAKTITNFAWPLRQGAGRTDFDFHAISSFVDENPAFPGQILDYQCGARTYDLASGYNHRGTDIFTWPFYWKKMDDEDVVIVAGAPGTIIHKSDGNYDRNCAMGSGSWNAVYVQHADGSVAWYGHMKNGSPTVKGVGETVAAGEYLGAVGSSGSSTGPHLHFELYDASNALVDPWLGPCNNLSKQVTWAQQRAYRDAGVNALTVGTAAPGFPTCPGAETSYATDYVTPGTTVYFVAYLRDQTAGKSVSIRVLRPDGSAYAAPAPSGSADYNASYWYWSFGNFPAIAGTWTFEATFDGKTYTKPFKVGVTPDFGVPLGMFAAAGDHQFTVPGSAFGVPLQAGVRDNLNRPVPGVKVTFTVPASGATAVLESRNAITDANGIAAVAAIANAATGVYQVLATFAGGPSVPFVLSNLPDPWGDSDSDGIPNGVETVDGRNPGVKDNDIFSPGYASARLFAMQQYRDFLGREGDVAGVTSWATWVSNGQYTRRDVIDAFFNSPEFNGFVAPVVRLYYATFLRVPDYAGLTFNAGLVRNGTVTLVQLADFFTASPEFAATYGALDNTAFVTLLYANVLGRAPDPAGLSGWLGLLDGGMSRGQVLLGFSDSVEYQAAKFNEVYVTMMYVAMLRRSPEPAGYAGWLAYLQQPGNTPLAMIDGFYLSTEYHDRFLP